MHDEFLMNEDGSFKLDADGQKIPNPEYVPPAGFEMTANIQAWHDAQVSDLKRSSATSQNTIARLTKEKTAAEAKIAELEDKLEAALKKATTADKDLEADIEARIENAVRKANEDKDAVQLKLDAANTEIHKLKYDGVIERETIGILDPEYKDIGLAELKSIFKPGDDGTLVPFENGEVVRGSDGKAMTPKDYIGGVWRLKRQKICLADSALPNGHGPKPGTSPELKNPFDEETKNLSKQSEIIKNDKVLARKLMQSAGYIESKINRMLS